MTVVRKARTKVPETVGRSEFRQAGRYRGLVMILREMMNDDDNDDAAAADDDNDDI